MSSDTCRLDTEVIVINKPSTDSRNPGGCAKIGTASMVCFWQQQLPHPLLLQHSLITLTFLPLSTTLGSSSVAAATQTP